MKRTLDKAGHGGLLPRARGGKAAGGPGRRQNVGSHGGVGQCLEFMTRNFSRPIQFRDLVKISKLSRRGFEMAFEKHIGANPGAVLRHFRLEHAKRLLTEQDLKLKDVAQQCGYRSVNSFCVAFQRTMGVAPKKFQRQRWLGMIRRNQRCEIPATVTCHRPPLQPAGTASAGFDHTQKNSTSIFT
jgi:transcriptional regulator GlxA family with amidase domain